MREEQGGAIGRHRHARQRLGIHDVRDYFRRHEVARRSGGLCGRRNDGEGDEREREPGAKLELGHVVSPGERGYSTPAVPKTTSEVVSCTRVPKRPQRSFSPAAAPSPAARPVAQAQAKLCPPIGPKASSISPHRNRPGCRMLSSVRGLTSVRATPPPVTSAFLYPSSPFHGRTYDVSASTSAVRSCRRNSG